MANKRNTASKRNPRRHRTPQLRAPNPNSDVVDNTTTNPDANPTGNPPPPVADVTFALLPDDHPPTDDAPPLDDITPNVRTTLADDPPPVIQQTNYGLTTVNSDGDTVPSGTHLDFDDGVEETKDEVVLDDADALVTDATSGAPGDDGDDDGSDDSDDDGPTNWSIPDDDDEDSSDDELPPLLRTGNYTSSSDDDSVPIEYDEELDDNGEEVLAPPAPQDDRPHIDGLQAENATQTQNLFVDDARHSVPNFDAAIERAIREHLRANPHPSNDQNLTNALRDVNSKIGNNNNEE